MLPIQISLRNLTLSPEMEADIRERAAGLRRYYDRIMGCRVTVEVPNRRHHEGSLHNVRIDLTVPGGELVVRRCPHEDLRTAVQIAFHAARRRLQDYARRQRGAVKAHELDRHDVGLDVAVGASGIDLKPAHHGGDVT